MSPMSHPPLHSTDSSGPAVVVIGGGHAGTEAAAAAARMGVPTYLITHHKSTIGQMSCNPAIGGVGKGHLVREIDALGGLMAQAADRAGLHFKVLNRSKGPAVRGPRAQTDRQIYKESIQKELNQLAHLQIYEGEVTDFVSDSQGRIRGVRCQNGQTISCRAVVLTAGTFLGGLIYRGKERIPAGRIGERPVHTMAQALRDAVPEMCIGRMKTGTPPRLDGRTIDYTKLTPQPGDEPPEPMSFMTTELPQKQLDCFLGATSESVHALIRSAGDESPVFASQFHGVGPRYCPSIEEKILKFPENQAHQIFFEPEGFHDATVYPNGISTSLSPKLQEAFIKRIVGLEQVKILQYGYAVEYDYIDPRTLEPSLAVKHREGLFFAGQINGTTGYEEAAGQGLMAGINAALYVTGRAPFVLDRSEAYLGVLVDDLTRTGVLEPYRMFTSRAEFRLLLRADNADERLTARGVALGLINDTQKKRFQEKRMRLEQARRQAGSPYGCEETPLWVRSPSELARAGIQIRQDGRKRSALELMGLPHVTLETLGSLWPEILAWPREIQNLMLNDAHYIGYYERQQKQIQHYQSEHGLRIPQNMDYTQVSGLSTEEKERLSEFRPLSLAEAKNKAGITPAGVLALLCYLKKKGS